MNLPRACLAFGALLLASVASPRGEAAPLTLIRADGVRVHFDVELASTTQARQRGLMGRRELPRNGGMWFDFGREQAVSMWMKNTPLPLDMLFFDADGRLVHVHARAEPYSLEHVTAPAPVRYVLEIAGGESARLAVARGDRAVVLPVRERSGVPVPRPRPAAR